MLHARNSHGVLTTTFCDNSSHTWLSSCSAHDFTCGAAWPPRACPVHVRLTSGVATCSMTACALATRFIAFRRNLVRLVPALAAKLLPAADHGCRSH